MAKAKTPAKAKLETPPWVRYERFTVEEILERCQRGGKALRRRVLAWEQGHQKREPILERLANWENERWLI
jgi:hypothetical protein